MLAKLDKLVAKHKELTDQLAEPDVFSNKERYLALSKEFADLSDVVTLYNHRKKKDAEMKGAIDMAASETDADLREMAEEEVSSLRAELEKIDKELKSNMNPPDPYDTKNVILEIRAGTGGAEAGLFGAELFRMYQRYIEAMNWKIEVLSISHGELDGIKEVIALVSGKKVYGRLKFESGVHRVQRVPQTETSGRIHTSAVTVAMMPEADEVELNIDPNELKFDVYRSSGPGGQSVNTTDSAVRITHVPTGLIVTCQDEKSQHKNKAKAMKILTSRLLDQKKREHDEKIAKERRQIVSTGDRSAKIRTYNYPQNRVTDHRINLTLHRLNYILEGDLDDLIDALRNDLASQNLGPEPNTN